MAQWTKVRKKRRKEKEHLKMRDSSEDLGSPLPDDDEDDERGSLGL